MSPRWLDFEEAYEQLTSIGLEPDIDFVLAQKGKGLPLPAVSSTREGIPLALISAEALDRFDRFDIRVRYRDRVGDIHEMVLDCAQRLPKVFSLRARTVPRAVDNGPECVRT